MTHPSPPKLDDSLRDWPLVESSDHDWEVRAVQIEAKVGAALPSGSLDILAAPLPEGPEDRPHSPLRNSKDRKMSDRPPERNRQSLKDLAKLANSPSLASLPSVNSSPRLDSTPPPPSVQALSSVNPKISSPPSDPDNDSGIVDLKAISGRDPDAGARSQSTPLASTPLFDEDTPTKRPTPAGAESRRSQPGAPPSGRISSTPAVPAAPVSDPVESRGPAAVRGAALEASLARASRPPPKSGSPLRLVGAGVVVAIAATLFFVFRPHPPAPEAVSSVTQSPSTPVAAAVPTTATAPAVAPAASVPSNAEVVAANAAPEAVAGGAANAPNGAAKGYGPRKTYVKPNETLGGSGTTVTGLSAMMAQAAKPADPAPVPPPDTAPGALGAALQKAAGSNGAGVEAAPTEAPAAPQFAPGSVPEKPSQGAVTSALGAVLPQARDCLNPDDPISRANVTFESTGGVTRVVVTGHAAGKPAEECIRTALLKAKVPPFAQASYSANITVRPN